VHTLDSKDRNIRPSGDFHPGVALLLVIFQVAGAWIASDISYVVIATTGNVVLQLLLRRRQIPLRIYFVVIGMLIWAIATRVGFSCSFDDSWRDLIECARHPRPGVSAACMATACVLVLSTIASKDRITRSLLRLGIGHRILWIIFVVPTLGHMLLDTTGRSASLMRGRYSQSEGCARWVRYRVTILTSAFVKTLSHAWYSREAAETRIRETMRAPVFLHNDRVLHRDFVLMGWAALSLALAYVY
jgi:hypothetical protein